MLTPTQKQAAQAIVNIFETAQVLGDYGSVTLIAGDTGHLTFGRSQTTLASGNLSDLLQRYCANAGAQFAERLRPYLPRFAARDRALDDDGKVHNILRASADDKVMRDTQDVFFDDAYWQPAMRTAERAGITTPLGVAVVYDSLVHGSWKLLSNRTTQQAGSVAALGERRWIGAYVARRREWFVLSPRSDLRKCVYRMDAFQRLIDQDYWGLPLPLVVRGHEVSLASLAALPVNCFDGPQPGQRAVGLQAPLQRGLDVRLVQLGLSERGVEIRADGIFGQTSARLLREYQATQGLVPTGVADPAFVVQLAG